MRHFLSFIIALCFAISSYAQIPSQVMGINLGKTPKATAISIFKKKGMTIAHQEKEHVFLYGNIFHQDVKWEYVHLVIKQSKVAGVEFYCLNNNDALLKSLNSGLFSKYGTCWKTKAKIIGYIPGLTPDEFNETYVYSNGKNRIQLYRHYYNGMALYLSYMNENLVKK